MEDEALEVGGAQGFGSGSVFVVPWGAAGPGSGVAIGIELGVWL